MQVAGGVGLMADIRIVLVGTNRLTQAAAVQAAPGLAAGFEKIARKNPQLTLLIERVDIEVSNEAE